MTEQSVSDAVEHQADTAVVVSRLVSRPVQAVWDQLMKPHGAEALLGEGGQLGRKGEDWNAADGTWGVVRSFHPLEQIRFSWHASADAPKSFVDLHLRKQDDEQTVLEIRHDQLPQDADRDALTKHWDDALERIDTGAQ